MSSIAIHAEGISKRYRFGSAQKSTYPTLRDSLVSGASLVMKRIAAAGRGSGARAGDAPSTFWALRDVSFEVAHGEAVGIIGNNGAGKSTLLKILSRITEPTEGYAEIHGRVGSLLEVGTGFHPELTGRENIFLNGAILGMRRSETILQFDGIVDFAGVERFIDTPVKYYSSGMHLRLAFAVAAHLKPEILIVDEVLAVGDATFQKKCLGKMDEVAKEGRTVLFVSHNMAVVQKLCARTILIQDGTVIADGRTNDVVTTYLEALERNASRDLLEQSSGRHGGGRVRLIRVEAFTGDRNSSRTLATGRPVRLIFHVDSVQPGIACTFAICDQLGQPVAGFYSLEPGEQDSASPDNGAALCCEIDELLLVPGRYRVDATIWCNGEEQDTVAGATFLEVEQGLLRGRPVVRNSDYGSVVMPHRWIRPG